MLEVGFMTFDQTLAKTERTTPTCVLRVYHLACTSCADTQSCHPLFFVSRLSTRGRGNLKRSLGKTERE